MSARRTSHGNCVALGEAGVLIRGRPGAGKSTLTAELVERATAKGMFARLVADDRVFLDAVDGRLIASPPDILAGLIERRGVGIFRAPYQPRAVVELVVDIGDAPDRTPEPGEAHVTIAGVLLPRLALAWRPADAAATILAALAPSLCGTDCDPSALAFAPQHENMSLSAPHAPSIRSGRARVARGGPEPERNEFCAENA